MATEVSRERPLPAQALRAPGEDDRGPAGSGPAGSGPAGSGLAGRGSVDRVGYHGQRHRRPPMLLRRQTTGLERGQAGTQPVSQLVAETQAIDATGFSGGFQHPSVPGAAK